jgi:hypothetical protein
VLRGCGSNPAYEQAQRLSELDRGNLLGLAVRGDEERITGKLASSTGEKEFAEPEGLAKKRRRLNLNEIPELAFDRSAFRFSCW